MFSLKDSVFEIMRGQLTPIGPVPGGAPQRVKSYNKIALAVGGKTNPIKGSGMLPIDYTIGTAEPKLELDCSDGPEVWSVRGAIGGVGTAIIATLTFARAGLIPTSFTFIGLWGDGGGIDLDETKGSAPDKITLPLTDVLQDGVSIYNTLA